MRALILLAVALPLAATAQDLLPGRYRTTTTTDLPAMAGKPVVDEDCITQKEIDEGLSKTGVESESNCKVSGMKRSPGKVSYQIQCQQDGMKTTGNVTGTLRGDAFDFVVVTSGLQAGGKPMRTRVVGKRLGSCK
ncbi:MAG: DUF3617 family protein [Betaproteobacteria bacterium]|nr:DUF3617 family protein [Betaproteobacteria bacterium]